MNPLMNVNIHHIGVAVNSIEKTAPKYEKLGYKLLQGTEFDPIQNVRACFYGGDNLPTVELIEPVDENSPINKILKKNGVGPYHFCYGVDNIEEVIHTLRKDGYILLGKPVPSTGMPGKKICFMYNSNIGLIELVEN